MKLKKNLALSDTGFVFDPSNGNSFATNPIGLSIVKLLKEGKDLARIKKQLLEMYDTDANTLEKDIYDFTNMLNKLHLNENDLSGN
jgi:hypothetical protein